MLVDFGFDLAGAKETRLGKGAWHLVLGGLVELIPLALAVYFLDAVLRGHPPQGGVLWSACALVLALACTAYFKSRGSVHSFVATYNLVCAARIRLADHLRRLPMGFWNRSRSGALSSLLTDEFEIYSEVVTHVWSLLIASLVKPLGACLLVAYLDWRLGLVAFSACIVSLAAIPWSAKIVNRASDRLHGVKSRAHGKMVEFAQGVETLRAFDQGSRYHQRLEALLEELEIEQLRMELAPAPMVLSFKLLVWLGFSLMLALGSGFVLDGTLDAIHFLIALILSLQIFEGASDFSSFLAMTRFSTRTLERIRELFELPIQGEGESQGDVPVENHQIEIRDLSFAYEDRPAIQNIRTRIPARSLTALVGPSGSGKSTLAHLVNRLWDYEHGSISLGGVELRKIPLQQLRSLVAMVLQDVVLFEDSVENNIRLGKPDASRQEVERCARAAQAHQFICALPDGYDTVLKDAGRMLSGGQRQRIAIARALLYDAPILILDEATSAVDLENEALIQKALSELIKDRTVLVIAHRLWTIQHADKILYLDQGRLLEEGNHAELLRLGGHYAKMWSHQAHDRS